jgi:gliding motility-associated lipoprotein GldD
MQLKNIKAVGFALAIALLAASCEKNYTPKHKGYFRIDFPEKEYRQFNEKCPFTFDYPQYAGVFPDSSSNAEPCWLNIRYQPFNATLHVTYKPLDNDSNRLDKLAEQSRKYAYEHTIKAQDIVLNEMEDTARKIFITTYSLEGETATSFRFYATDNKNHYLDGAFYFNHRTNIDSIAPVQEYLMKDINHMLETLKWK